MFQGLEGEIGREGPSDEVRDWRGERVDKVEEGEEDDSTDSQECLGHLRVLLKRVQHWVLCELPHKESGQHRSGGHGRAGADLLVELAEMVVDLVLDLNENRVLLDLLCCGHLGTQ